MFYLITCCSPHTFKRPILPLISQIYADETQNNINLTTCLSLRDNAACCIPLRDLRYLRENIHMRVLNLSAQRNPSVSRRSRRFTQTKPKTTLTTQNCLSLRNNAACCIPLRDLRYLRENIHMRVLNLSTQKKPQCLSQITQIIADEPQNSLNLTKLSFSAI